MKLSHPLTILFLIITLIAIFGSAFLIFNNLKSSQRANTSEVSSTKTNQNIKLINGEKEITLKLEIADTDSEREKGYMYRKEIGNDESMLFIFDDSAERSFWMKDTYVPLDMIFFDENKTFVSVQKNAEPCVDKGYNCPSYFSNGNAKYVLETKAGAVDSAIFDKNLGFQIQ